MPVVEWTFAHPRLCWDAVLAEPSHGAGGVSDRVWKIEIVALPGVTWVPMILRLVVSGAALALGTFLVLSGVVILVAILAGQFQQRLLVVTLLYTLLLVALGSLLVIVGWRAWRQSRST